MISGYCGCDAGGHRSPGECPRWREQRYNRYRVLRAAQKPGPEPTKMVFSAPVGLSEQEIDWLISQLDLHRAALRKIKPRHKETDTCHFNSRKP